MVSIRRVLVLGAFCGGLVGGAEARAETLIQRAQKAATNGKPDAAFAYADAAVEHAQVKDELRKSFRDARASFAHAWVIKQLHDEGLITDANAETSFAALAALHDLFGKREISDPLLDDALAYATTLLIARVQTLGTAGDYGHAEALMAAIARTTPGHDAELATLRARAFEARSAEAQATAARPAAAFVHLTAAGRFGSVPSDRRATAQAAVALVTHTQRHATVTGECFGMETQLAVDDSEPGVPVKLDVRVADCVASGPSTSTGTKEVGYQRKEMQQVAKSHVDHKEVCTDYTTEYKYSNGATANYSTHTACHTEYFVVDDPPEQRVILVPASESVGTTTTTSDAKGHGHVIATWPAGSLERDVTAEGIAIGVHYDEPREAPRPTDEGTGSVEAAQQDLVKALRDKILEVDIDVRAQMAADLRQRARSESDPLAIEDDLETAAILAGKAPDELVSLAHDRYHMGPEELDAALFGRELVLPTFATSLKLPEVTAAEVDEDRSTYQALYFDSATGRSAVTYTIDFGYARTTAPGKAEKGTFVAALDFYWAVPIKNHDYAVIGTLFDFRAGTGGLVEMRLGAGPGINFHGLLVNPLASVGVGKYGTPDQAMEPNLQYNVALEAEAAVRLGFAIPHVLAVDATFARRRRIATLFAVENRVDLALRVRPVAVMLQYTQLSTDTGDYFGGVTLAHEQGQMLQLLVGFGL